MWLVYKTGSRPFTLRHGLLVEVMQLDYLGVAATSLLGRRMARWIIFKTPMPTDLFIMAANLLIYYFVCMLISLSGLVTMCKNTLK